MNKTLLESQEGVLYFTSLALSMISAISSVALHSVQNPQTLQRFLSPLYIAEYKVLVEMAGYDPNSQLTLKIFTDGLPTGLYKDVL